jgi:bidirectional [NiFe] hydrogenase diaphorase subunit
MSVVTFTMNDEQYSAKPEETILKAARDNGVFIPTLCFLEGLSAYGACRLCLVEIEGSPKLLPACTTKPTEGMVVHTDSDKLKKYRKMMVELLASEGNHQCAVCVLNGHCELQNLAYVVELDHVHFPYLFPDKTLDATHKEFVMDRNRCVLCTRCIRVCDEVEGAHVWDLANRGIQCSIIADLNQPWGTSPNCTSCGKCVRVCPTGAIFEKGATVGEMQKERGFIEFLMNARKYKEWAHTDEETQP